MLNINKMKILLITLSLFVSMNVLSQSITTTLGTNGTFSIKNGSSNYFTISQSSGQVHIPNTLRLGTTTGPTQGVLYFGANRFMHVYGSNNTFLGENAGNFTLTGPGIPVSAMVFFNRSRMLTATPIQGLVCFP